MKFLIISFLLLIPIDAIACTKEIKVLEYREKSLPSLLDLKKKTMIVGEKKILIACKLYEEISVGDILYDPDKPMEVNLEDGFFMSPVEERRYKVLSK